MPTLYLVRHGQTEYNANMIVQGRCDSPLTDLGIDQASTTAETLKSIDFSRCYHSPLGRTVHTATIVTKNHDIELIPENDLMEIDLGHLEGKCFTDKDYEEAFMLFWRYPAKYVGSIHNGEEYNTLEERIYNCCKEIAGRHNDDEAILIVSHGAAIRSFLNPLLDKPREHFWTDPDVKPASISIVRWDKDTKPELISVDGVPAGEIKTPGFDD